MTVSKADYQNLGIKLNNIARQAGYDPNLTPKGKGFLDELQNLITENAQLKIADIDQLRKVAQVPANSIDNTLEAAIGSKIIGAIDDFIEDQGSNLARDYGADVEQSTRRLETLSRVKKAELLDEAVFRASEAASSFENGLRNEFRSILKSKKKRRGFTKDEIEAMQQVTQGGTMENTFKKLGKLGFGADQQTNMLLGSLGFAGGFAAGGLLGAAAVPSIGYVSAKIAKLGSKNAQFAQDVVRAGRNGEEIAEAYIKNVPKRLQSPEELSALLADPSVDASADALLLSVNTKGIRCLSKMRHL